MIFVERIDQYRDGGTISIKGRLITKVELEICIDQRIKSQSKGTVWWGYPKDDCREDIITEKDNIKFIIEAVESYKGDDTLVNTTLDLLHEYLEIL